MKKICLILSLLALLSLPLFAEDSAAKKFYCSPDQVLLGETMILVQLDYSTVEIDKLHVDQGGIYFHEDAMRCLQCRQTLNPKNTCECPVIN